MQDRQIKLDESQVNSTLCSVTQQYYFCLKKCQLLLALDLSMWQNRGVVLERQKKGASTSVPGYSGINTLNTLGC